MLEKKFFFALWEKWRWRIHFEKKERKKRKYMENSVNNSNTKKKIWKKNIENPLEISGNKKAHTNISMEIKASTLYANHRAIRGTA